MLKIAPSILSGNFLNLEPDLRMINDNADLIHIDVMDGSLVPNISFGFPLAEAMAKVMTVPMDVHLMIVNPWKYIERFAKVGAGLISFHLEACDQAGKDPSEVIAMVKATGAKAGIAINPDVPVERLFPYIEEVDFFLIMSVFAGFGGQKFIEESVDRIKTLKAEMDRRGIVRDIEGLVETSTNLASVKMAGDGKIVVVTSQRSSVTTSREEIAKAVADCFRTGGAVVEHHSEYPGWKPNPDSPILRACVSSYRKLFGREPQVKAIHAGLECGLFEEKFGGLDMISFGPTLRGVHAPGERLDLASLERFTAHLIDVITNCNQTV